MKKAQTRAAAKARPTPRKRVPVKRTRASATAAVGDEERRRMIAEAAYYKAERRGFAAGHDEQDWLEACAEIDARLSPPGGTAPARRRRDP